MPHRVEIPGAREDWAIGWNIDFTLGWYSSFPVFPLANAGSPSSSWNSPHCSHPPPLGITAGQVFGKQLGMFLASLIEVKPGVAKLPGGVSWLLIHDLACLCDIGFTMRLFIRFLAFE